MSCSLLSSMKEQFDYYYNILFDCTILYPPLLSICALFALEGGFEGSECNIIHNSICCVSCSTQLPDGRIVIGSKNADIRLFDPVLGTVESFHEKSQKIGFVSALTVVSSSRAMIACGFLNGTLEFWDLHPWRCIFSIQGHSGWITSLLFIESTQILVSASVYGFIKFWSVPTRDCIHTIKNAHDSRICDMQKLPNGSLITIERNVIKLWDMHVYSCVSVYHVVDAHKLLVFPDGLVCICHVPGSLSVWDFSLGSCVYNDESHYFSRPYAAAIVQNLTIDSFDISRFHHQAVINYIITGQDGGDVKVWNSRLECINSVHISDNPVKSIHKLPNGSVICLSVDE